MPSTSSLYSLSLCSSILRHYIQDCYVQKVTVHAGVLLLSDATALSSPRSPDVDSCWVSACYACWFHARFVIEYLWLALCLCLEQPKIRQTSSGRAVLTYLFLFTPGGAQGLHNSFPSCPCHVLLVWPLPMTSLLTSTPHSTTLVLLHVVTGRRLLLLPWGFQSSWQRLKLGFFCKIIIDIKNRLKYFIVISNIHVMVHYRRWRSIKWSRATPRTWEEASCCRTVGGCPPALSCSCWYVSYNV